MDNAGRWYAAAATDALGKQLDAQLELEVEEWQPAGRNRPLNFRIERLTTRGRSRLTLESTEMVHLSDSRPAFGQQSTMMLGSNNSPFSEHRREPTRSRCAACTGDERSKAAVLTTWFPLTTVSRHIRIPSRMKVRSKVFRVSSLAPREQAYENQGEPSGPHD